MSLDPDVFERAAELADEGNGSALFVACVEAGVRQSPYFDAHGVVFPRRRYQGRSLVWRLLFLAEMVRTGDLT